MLGKLMKYELLATGRKFLPIYCALLLAALINCLFISLKLAAPIGIASSIYGGLIIAIMVMTLVLTIQRFRRNLLGREGYLMMTLPVSPDSLIWSKMLTATIWYLAGSLVTMLSMMIVASTNLRQFLHLSLSAFLQLSGTEQLNIVLIALECLLLLIVGSLTFSLMMYACISTGMLVRRRKMLLSFGVFIALYTVIQILVVWLGIAAKSLQLDEVLQGMESYTQVHLVMLLVTCCLAVLGAICYLFTRFMLTRRLNLE